MNSEVSSLAIGAPAQIAASQILIQMYENLSLKRVSKNCHWAFYHEVTECQFLDSAGTCAVQELPFSYLMVEGPMAILGHPLQALIFIHLYENLGGINSRRSSWGRPWDLPEIVPAPWGLSLIHI